MGPPPSKKARRQVILEEDVYVAAIEAIVERDFFPDIPKLQNRLEWLEAVRSGNPVVIRDTQMRIIQRRANRAVNATPSVAGTPATGFRTPVSVFGITSPAPSLAVGVAGSGGFQPPPGSHLSLDDFLRMYTSEDNASFKDLKEIDDWKRRQKAESRLSLAQTAERVLTSQGEGAEEQAVRVTDGFGTTGQPSGGTVGWDYTGRNLLMYDSSNRDDAPLTQQEIEERAKGPPKEVSRTNTRFHGAVFDTKKGPGEETVAILYNTPLPGVTPNAMSRHADQGRHYDLQDFRGTPGRGGSYPILHTPSPAPGVEESPFMTWGDIEGTPLRLEMEDTPIGIGGSADGPHFKIPAVPTRDEVAHNMSRSAAKNIRQRKQHGQGGYTPSPRSAHGGLSPALGGLSAAAQKFVNKAMRKSSAGTDSNLRASYGGTTPSKSPSVRISRDVSQPLRSPSVGVQGS